MKSATSIIGALAVIAKERESVRDHAREHVGLQTNEQAYQGRERDTVEEDVPKDRTLLTHLPGGHASHHDALGVDHLAHHTARAIGSARLHRRGADVLPRA